MKYVKFLQQVVFLFSSLVLLYSLFVVPTLYAWLWFAYAILFVGIIISAFYHRQLTHRAWKCPRWLEYVLTILAAGHALTPAISWTAIHRKHHRMSDTIEDPHGPKIGFINNALISFYKTDLKYAGRLLKDKLYMFQVNYYVHIAVVYFIVWSFIFGPTSWLIINGYAYIAQASINWITHKDGPLNLSHVHALFFSGETYHKNHHIHPNEATTGLVDLPYHLFIKVIDPEISKRTPLWKAMDDSVK